MGSILEGMRVISWTVGATGPMAATILGDMGAEVIKVEDPRVGDMARTLNRAHGVNLKMPAGSSLIWEKNNRNARGIALNLKTPKGLEAMYRIVEKSDALIQNYRAGAAARLGMDYETLREINPKLVYASSTGYGHKGPYVDRPNLDTVTLAASGNMTLAGGPDAPPVNNSGMADQMGAVWLAFGAVAALLARERHGFGQEVFSSGLGAMINLQSIAVLSRTATGQGPGHQDRADARNPLANWYRCKGGRWIVLALVQGDRYWATLCKALSLPELEGDPRFATLLDREENNRELIAIFDAKFAERTYEEWDRAFQAAGDLIYTRINNIADLEDDPQVIANDYITEWNHPRFGKMKVPGFPVQFSETPQSLRLAAPELGEHTEEVLQEYGYTWDDLQEMKAEGAIL